MFDSIDDDAFEQKICMSVVRLRSVHGGRVLHGVPVRLRRAVVRPSAVRRQGAAGPRVRLSTVRRKVSVPHDCQLPSAHHQRTSGISMISTSLVTRRTTRICHFRL